MGINKILAAGLGVVVIGSLAWAGIATNNANINADAVSDALAQISTMQGSNAELVLSIEQQNEAIAAYGVQIEEMNTVIAGNEQIIADYAVAEAAAIEAAAVAEAEEIVAAEEITEFSGYEEDGLALNFSDAFTLDNDDFEKLGDYEVEFDGNDVDIVETLAYSGAFASNDKDFNGETMYKLAEDDVEYVVEFDTGLDFDNDSLEVSFLGKEIEITDIEDGEFTIKEANKVFGAIGDVIEGIEIFNIGENAVMFKSGEEIEVLEEGEDVVMNGLEIELEDIFYSNTGDSMVSIRIGNDLDKVIEEGDYADEAENWEYTTIEDGKIVLSLAEDFDEDDTALKAGDTFALPEDFATLSFELSTENMNSVDVEYKSDDEVVFKGDFEDAEGDVYYNNSLELFIDDEGDNFTTLVLKDSDYKIEFDNVTNTFSVGDIEFSLDIKTLLKVNTVNETDTDDNLKSALGIEISAPEDDMKDGELSFEVPEEAIEATIKVE